MLCKKATEPCSVYTAWRTVDESNPAVFFDSTGPVEPTARWSMLCLEPFRTISQDERGVYLNAVRWEGDFYECLEAQLAEGFPHEGIPKDVPFKGGFAGFLSYDFGRKSCGVATRFAQKPGQLAYLMDPDCIIAHDRLTEEVWMIAAGRCRAPEEQLRWMEELLRAVPAQHAVDQQLSTASDTQAPWTSPFTEEAYKQAVDTMIDYIIEGDIYVVNMTHTLSVASSVPPLRLHERLRQENPSPFGGYIRSGQTEMVCASPERFMCLRDGVVQTKPIKGTRPRGKTPEEDAANAAELAASEKDRSELLMIVDLERNDLNRVCDAGTVRVTKHYEVETHPTVFHLVTTIEGRLSAGNTPVDLLRCAFPGGSITGAPKRRAMEVIDVVERGPRGPYTGSMLYLGFDGAMDSNIIIRTALVTDGGYEIGVGGGVTCDSDVQFEYDETLQKAKALLEALDEA